MDHDQYIRSIQNYQRRIEKAKNPLKESEVKHCLRKLSLIPITLKELEATGVGKTVNSLIKLKGGIQERAALLVAKWKRIAKDELVKKCGNDSSDIDDSDSNSEIEASSSNNISEEDNSSDGTLESSPLYKHKKRVHHDREDSARKKKRIVENQATAYKKTHREYNKSNESVKSVEKASRKSEEKVKNRNTSKSSPLNVSKPKADEYDQNDDDNVDSQEETDTESEEGDFSENESGTSPVKVKVEHEEDSPLNSVQELPVKVKLENAKNSPVKVKVENKHLTTKEKTKETGVEKQKDGQPKVKSDDKDVAEHKKRRETKVKSKEKNKVEKKKDGQNSVHSGGEKNSSRGDTGHKTNHLSKLKSEEHKTNLSDVSKHKRSSTNHHEKNKHKHRSSNTEQGKDKHEAKKYHHGGHKESHSSNKSHSSHSKEKDSQSKNQKEKRSSKKEKPNHIESESSPNKKSGNNNVFGSLDSAASTVKQEVSQSPQDFWDSQATQLVNTVSSGAKTEPSVSPMNHLISPESIKCEPITSPLSHNFDGAGCFSSPIAPSPKMYDSIFKNSSYMTSPLYNSPSTSGYGKNQKDENLLSDGFKLSPLDVDISTLSSDDSFDYLQSSQSDKQASSISEEDALISIMTTKNQKTKVYSGCKNKMNAKVLSLFELCIRSLQEHIESLEYTGGVPYLVIKPVLERTTPEQLASFENYNSYIKDDSDELWEFHVKKAFRNAERKSDESWRDLYQRCIAEREKKLQSLRRNINMSMANSAPVRITKLAYVDNYVKPPRGIARKQAATGSGTIIKPHAIKKRISNIPQPNPAAIQSVKERLAAKFSSSAAVTAPAPSSSASQKTSLPAFLRKEKKPAPLMRKAMQLMKGSFRR